MTSSSGASAADKTAKSIGDLSAKVHSGSSARENSTSSKKTLDLEPNPFEQSFAQNKVKGNSRVRGQNSNQGTSSSFLQSHATRTNQNGITQQVFPQSISPPILTPGGSRRLPPTSVLPPLVGMLTPGGGSLPGTPGIWSALLGAGVTPGSATSPYFNIPALADSAQGVRPQTSQMLPNSSSRQSQGIQPQHQKQRQQHQRQAVQLGQTYYAEKEGINADDTSLLRGGNANTGFVPQLPARLPSVGSINGLMGSIPSFTTTPGGSVSTLSVQPNPDGSATDANSDGTGQTIIGLKMSDDVANSATPRRKRELSKMAKEPANKKKKVDDKARKAKLNVVKAKHGKVGRKRKSRNDMTEEEKRRNFLERNRLAASKCRQRKKKMVEKMKEDLQFYTSQYSTLTSHISILREHVLTLRTILYAHKGCQKLIEQVGGVETLNTLLNGTNYVSQLPQAHHVPTPPSVQLQGIASPAKLDNNDLNTSRLPTRNFLGNNNQSQSKVSARGSVVSSNSSALNNSLMNTPASNTTNGASANVSELSLQGGSPPQAAVAAAVALSANSLINRHQNARIHN